MHEEPRQRQALRRRDPPTTTEHAKTVEQKKKKKKSLYTRDDRFLGKNAWKINVANEVGKAVGLDIADAASRVPRPMYSATDLWKSRVVGKQYWGKENNRADQSKQKTKSYQPTSQSISNDSQVIKLDEDTWEVTFQGHSLGMKVAQESGSLVVTLVTGQAESRGVEIGDRIVSLNGVLLHSEIATKKSLATLIQAMPQPLRMVISKGRSIDTADLKIGKSGSTRASTEQKPKSGAATRRPENNNKDWWRCWSGSHMASPMLVSYNCSATAISGANIPAVAEKWLNEASPTAQSRLMWVELFDGVLHFYEPPPGHVPSMEDEPVLRIQMKGATCAMQRKDAAMGRGRADGAGGQEEDDVDSAEGGEGSEGGEGGEGGEGCEGGEGGEGGEAMT
jgi:hypothetical protein